MKMPFLLISPKIVPKIQLIKKSGCFEYHAVIADKIEYRYIHRASICPASGMDRRSFFMPKTMGKYKRLEVFHLSKPVYTADKPSDCHYCYYWTNGRKGCRLGRNNCYYTGHFQLIKERQQWKSIASFQYTTINSVFIQAHTSNMKLPHAHWILRVSVWACYWVKVTVQNPVSWKWYQGFRSGLRG